jgi:hypothetical protein
MRKPRVWLFDYCREKYQKENLLYTAFSQSEPFLSALRTLLLEMLLLDNFNVVIEIAFYDFCKYI